MIPSPTSTRARSANTIFPANFLFILFYFSGFSEFWSASGQVVVSLDGRILNLARQSLHTLYLISPLRSSLPISLSHHAQIIFITSILFQERYFRFRIQYTLGKLKTAKEQERNITKRLQKAYKELKNPKRHIKKNLRRRDAGLAGSGGEKAGTIWPAYNRHRSW